jgi:FtsZ-binding cell division protein ZapB
MFGSGKIQALQAQLTELQGKLDTLTQENSRLTEVNEELRKENKAYKILQKYLGKGKVENIAYMVRTFKHNQIPRQERRQGER